LGSDFDLRQAVNAQPPELADAIEDREVVILRSGVQLQADVLANAPDLRLVLRAGAGLDNIDVEYAREHGIRVARVPGMSAQPVAEFTFALLLALARRIVLADAQLRVGHWPKAELGGSLLFGKTLGVVGAGNIGSQVGQMAAAWGLNVLGCVEEPTVDVRLKLSTRGLTLTDFESVIEQSDFVCLHVPLTEGTRHMVDDRALKAMRPGSLLVNVARGGVVDEEALYRHLTEGDTLAGAALDVHEHEGEGTISRFAELPNVVLTPHIGAMALDTQRLIGERLVELIRAFQDGKFDKEVRGDEHVA
jgi:phosphoglycerate dehydrogenase-like enzyme